MKSLLTNTIRNLQNEFLDLRYNFSNNQSMKVRNISFCPTVRLLGYFTDLLCFTLVRFTSL